MKYLQHPVSIISCFMLAIGFNLPHMVQVYETVAQTNLPHWYAWCIMVVIELGVLFLAANDQRYAAQAFAWLIFIINLCHYMIGFDVLRWETIPAVLFSAVPAFFVWYFADLFSEMIREKRKQETAKQNRVNVQKTPVSNAYKRKGKTTKKRSTPTEKQVIEYVQNYEQIYGRKPSYQEIADGLKSNKSTVYKIAKELNGQIK